MSRDDAAPAGGGASPKDGSPSDGVARTQSFYTQWAGLYDLLARRTPHIQDLRGVAVDALSLRSGETVVEMGCGTGANLSHFRDRVGPDGTVVGVDFSPGMLARAKQTVDSAGWENVHVVRGDAARHPVETADAVFASFVVGMLSDSAGVVHDWASFVGAGGRLALMDLARSTRPVARPLNAMFRGLVLASSPPGTRHSYDSSPTVVLDRRVAAAHRALRECCDEVTYSTHALGFVRISGGRVR
ncbi:MAG: class I SAM-dependent methyltransferase [Halobacteriota archaeon]